jgi:hypothetical protein
LTGGLAGCAYDGGGIGNPLTRRLAWFSFVGGEDLRRDCRSAAAGDHVRLVYNALWDEQVRVYELDLTAAGQLDQQVLGPVDLPSFRLSDPGRPWHGVTARTSLSAEQGARLMASLRQSGAFDPPTAGLRLPSDSFYWTVAACTGGAFHFNGWLYPGEAFARITFPSLLFALDQTGVEVNPPRPPGIPYSVDNLRAERERWIVQVGEDGLVGAAAP